MKNLDRLFRSTLIAVFAILFSSASAMAVSSYLTAFTTQYPSSATATTASWSSSGARCNICHSSGGGTDLNAFGAAWAARHNAGRTPAQAFQDIELNNADGSAANNIDEINANAQPGWRPGANNTLFDIFTPTAVTLTNQNPPTTLIGSADPASALPTVTISATTPNASETGPTAGQFTVTRSGATTSVLAINYTIGGTATNGTDYSTLSGSATIPASSATIPITVTPLVDALTEGTETVILTLSANAAYTLGSPSSATVNIADNPPPPPPTLPTVSIAATSPNASETGPTAGRFTVSRTGSTAASLVVNYTTGGSATNTTDYATLSGIVTIPAASATALITVAPVDDALVEGSETVILTLSANAAYTVGSPNSATVTIADNDSATPPPPPPSTGPLIALNTAKLDFGQAQINNKASRTASVHNIGDATLEVTGMTLCPGTSSEYTWSPNTFTVNPGSSQTLTVFYQPVDQTSDAGCLQIASNDTTQNPENLALAGVGIVPSAGPVSDIDISKFSVSRQVNLMRLKPVHIQVSVRNPGSVSGSAAVTVIGAQNNSEIYNQTMSVTLSKRGNKRLVFPPYTPTTQGDILWTVTVDDADPDFDEATATTKVVLGENENHHGRGEKDGEDD